MAFTTSTVLSTLLISSFSILLLKYTLSKARLIANINFNFIFVIILAIIFRMFLPVQFPFQGDFPLTKIYPIIYMIIRKKVFTIDGTDYNITSLLVVISLIGSLFFIVKLLISYLTMKSDIKTFDPITNIQSQELIESINISFNKTSSFEIVQSPEVSSPFIFGLYKPTIVLPALEFSESELRYALSHEMSHYYYKDLWLRFGCELLQVFYWWNPMIYLLRKQIIKIQELRVDKNVAKKMDELQKIEYLQFLLKIAHFQSLRKGNYVAAFNSKHSEVETRITSLLNTNKTSEPKRRQIAFDYFILILLTINIAFISNFINFEPYYIPEEIKKDTVPLDEIDYLIYNKNGEYDAYVDGKFFAVVSKEMAKTTFKHLIKND